MSQGMPDTPIVLILDSDTVASAALAQTLGRAGYTTLTARSAGQAIEQIDRAGQSLGPGVGVAVVDLDRGGPDDGLAFCERLGRERRGIVPVVMTGYRKVESAVRAMRCGAVDLLLKPLIEAELRDALERAVQSHLLLADPLNEQAQPAEPDPPPTPGDAPDAGWTPMPLSEAMKLPEKRILRAALEANGWNRGQTAQQLGINRTTLYKKIRAYRLDEPGG